MVARVVERLRASEPTAIGVLVHGSYARNRAQPESDLDLAVLVEGPSGAHYRSWFEELEDRSLLYVSAHTDLTVERWRAQQEEPEDWSFGFPAVIRYEWVWTATHDVRLLLGDPPIERHPAGDPEVEDMVESTTKVIRGERASTGLGSRRGTGVHARTPRRARGLASGRSRLLGARSDGDPRPGPDCQGADDERAGVPPRVFPGP
ncbi:MAG: nucleotidyltransferase domain-containing protein [Actinomycetota bacterium]|nr:nucleotidyltransferase domain-containing protein [Actinomycetota bacterium]